MYVCESCREELQPDDQVVAAAEQVAVDTQEKGREYLDGVRVLFHETHWPGDSGRLKERARGTLRELTSG